MSEPFRDDFAAALDRAAHLARENEDLRQELARLRAGSSAYSIPEPRRPPPGAPSRPPKPSPPDSLKRQTLDRLERLSNEIDSHDHPPEPERPPPPPRPPPAPPAPRDFRGELELARTKALSRERAANEVAELRQLNEALQQQLVQSRAPTPKVVAFVGALLVAFWLGLIAGHLLHGLHGG